MDETYIGGKHRKGNAGSDGDGLLENEGAGTKKTPVVGMIERGGEVKAEARLDRILNNKKMIALAKSDIRPDKIHHHYGPI